MTYASIAGCISASGISTTSPWATWNGSFDGTAVSFSTTTPILTNIKALSATSAIVTYQNSGGDNHIYAVVGTISGNAVAWGTPVDVSGVTGDISSIAVLSSTKVIVGYGNTLTGFPNAVVLDISGTVISVTLLNIAVVALTAYESLSITPLTSTTALMVYNGPISKGRAVVLSVSSSVITVNTSYQFNSTVTASGGAVSTISSTQALVVYGDDGNGSKSTAMVLDISGTTVTGNTKYVFSVSYGAYFVIAAISSSKFVVAYDDGNDSDFSHAQVLAVSGTVVSFGSSVRIINTIFASPDYVSIAKADSQSAFIVYRNVTNSQLRGVVGSIVGTVITLDTPVTVKNVACNGMSVTNLDNTHVIYSYHNGVDNKGYGKVSATS